MKMSVVTLLAVVLLTCTSSLSAGQTLITDKPDYAPGEIAILVGHGFDPGEAVRLQVVHADSTPSTGADHEPWAIVADEDGGFTTTWHVCEDDCVGATLKATADGQTSGLHAETTFTDSPKVGSVTVGAQSPADLCPGSSATYTVTVSRGSGGGSSGAFTATLSVTTALPTGASASFAPNPVSFTPSDASKTSTLTISTTGATPGGTTSFTVKAATSASDFATAGGTLTVDTTPPTISAAGANATIQCPNAPVFTAPTATDACDAAPVVSEVSDVTTPTACAGVYSRTRTWKATDASGNMSGTVSQTITVQDITAPVIGAPGGNATIDCPAAPVFTAPTASDACDPSPVVLEVSDVTTPGVCPGVYDRTKTWQAKDCSGNLSGTASQTIHVVDTTAPGLSALPGPTTLECPAAPSFATPTATDACDPSPTLTFADVTTPGSCPQAYAVTRTWTATDHCGNSSQASQTIHVVDTTAPGLSTLPGPTTLECPASPVFSSPSASDACDPAPSLTFSDLTTPGSCPQAYAVTRTWTATDHCGNSSQASQTIHVVDTTAPGLSTLPGPTTIECPATPSFATPTATDACDPSPTLTFADVTTPGSCPQASDVTRTWTATDHCGNSSQASQTIHVVDTTAPVVAITGPPSGSVYAVGTPVTFIGTFTDNCGSPHTATWMFDAITQSGTVTEGAPGAVTATYTFTAAGVYMVKLTVTDACGNASTATQIGGMDAMVVIYDPNAGFVTGGGWINSPAGAYTADPSLAGRANFGFVSKYLKGAKVPTGETEFQYQVGNLNFHSTAYQWLVISGPDAQYKGSGTINGISGYTFLLTAQDGQISGGGGTDKFRMKIWNAGGVVYDNQMASLDDAVATTALGGGSIVIHSSSSTGTASLIQAPVDDQLAGSAPIEFALAQNAPNPFRGQTAIRFSLAEQSQVSLSVYDIAGRQVASLAEGDWAPGEHLVVWSGRTTAGSRANGGVYFVRFEARSPDGDPRFTSQRKMILVP